MRAVVPREVWSDYALAFFRLSDAFSGASRDDESAVTNLLGRVCHMVLRPDDDGGPLIPMPTTDKGRLGGIADFREEELSFLAAILPEVDDAALAARIGDVVWIRLRKGEAGRRAGEAYQELINGWVADGRFMPDALPRRLLDLAASLGRRGPLFASASEKLQQAVWGLNLRGLRKETLPLIRALAHHRQGDPAQFNQRLESWGEESAQQADWPWAEHWLWFAQQYAALSKDGAASERAIRARAKVLVAHAEEEVRKDPPNHAGAAHWLQAAVRILQQLGGTHVERGELTTRALEHNRLAAGQMHRVTHHIRAGETIRFAQRAVVQPTFRASYVALARLIKPLSKSEIEQDTRRSIALAPLSGMSGGIVSDPTGRVRAVRAPLSLGPGAEEGTAFRQRVVESAAFYQHFDVHAIAAAQGTIERRHYPSMDELLLLAASSPFVPPGREYSVARGLYLGFRGDFGTAAHLLLPQVENALRCLLNAAGIVTVVQDKDGTQKERNLAMLLEVPELCEILGEDTVFDLQVLLVEPLGANLRNRAAHGLMDDRELASWAPVYFWWSVLRLCVLPLLPAPSDPESADQQKVEPGDSDSAGRPAKDGAAVPRTAAGSRDRVATSRAARGTGVARPAAARRARRTKEASE